MHQFTHWQKSSFSGMGPDNNCLEIGLTSQGLLVRESENPDFTLSTTEARLKALLGQVRSETLGI